MSRLPRKWLVSRQMNWVLSAFSLTTSRSSHGVDDVHGSGSQISGICRLTRALKLCIVSIQMHAKSELYNQSLNIGRIENVQERAKHRALRHTRTHYCAMWDRFTVVNCLRATDDEWPHPVECWSCEPEGDGQSVEKDGVIDRVESGTHIEQSQQRDLFLVHWGENVRQYPKQTRLGGIMLSESRLQRRK